MEKYNKTELSKLILEQNKSYEAIGRIYGVSGNAIKKAAKSLGISLSPRRKINENENFSHPKKNANTFISKVDDETFVNIIETSTLWKEISQKLGYKNEHLSQGAKNFIKERCSKLGIELNVLTKDSISDKTKGELFKQRKNWQSARTSIRKNAYKVFSRQNPNPKCAICGYKYHIEIAHIKAVSDFDDDATIREINSITNLIGLCPNHHWEYDNGIITI